MDANGTAPRDDEGPELDLNNYPAEQGRSLLGVAAERVAKSLPRLRAIPVPDVNVLPLWSQVALGLALGAGLGVALTLL